MRILLRFCPGGAYKFLVTWWHGIKSANVPRMTFTKTFHCESTACPKTMFSNGLNRIVRTVGKESTPRSDNGTNRPLIHPYEQYPKDRQNTLLLIFHSLVLRLQKAFLAAVLSRPSGLFWTSGDPQLMLLGPPIPTTALGSFQDLARVHPAERKSCTTV